MSEIEFPAPKTRPLTDAELELAVPEQAHSWAPVNLVQADSLPPEPPTIGGVLYPGRRSLISGETEALKTWFALILAKAEMDAGYAVCWADVDAMGRGEILMTLLRRASLARPSS